MTDDFETQWKASRDDVATMLHGLGDGMAAGTIRLRSAAEEVTVDVPDQLDVEVEFEVDDGELSLEVELEWPDDTAEHGSRSRPRGVDEKTAEREDDPDVGSTNSVENVEGVPTEEPDIPEAEDRSSGPEPATGSRPSGAEPGDTADESAHEETVAALAGPGGDDAARRESLGRFELFEDRAGEWRWRLVHRNGNVIATSGEGYTRKHNARKGLRSVLHNAPGAEVTEEHGEDE